MLNLAITQTFFDQSTKLANAIDEVHLTALGCSLSHLHVSRGVICLDVRVNGFFDQALLKLGLCQLTPHWWLIAALSKLISSVQVTNVFNQNLYKMRQHLDHVTSSSII